MWDELTLALRRTRRHPPKGPLGAHRKHFPAPTAVTAEAIRLLHSGDQLRYTVATGIPELRDAIARHQRTHGLDVDVDVVVVTTLS